VRYRPAGFLWRFAGHGEDLCNLLGSEFPAATRPRQVAKHLGDSLPQCPRFLGALNHYKFRKRSLPATPPDSDAVTFASESHGDGPVVEPFEGEKDDFSPVGKSLRTRPRPRHRLENLLLSLGDEELACHP
jgi:hypothetical protein